MQLRKLQANISHANICKISHNVSKRNPTLCKKKKIYHDQVALFQVGKFCLIFENPSVNVSDHLSRLKEKHHIVASIDTEKALDKILHSCIIENSLNKLRIEGNFLT